MQLQTIRDEVRYRAGVDGQDSMATDTILTSLINGAIREITNLRDWDWNVASESISTVAGTTAYNRAAAARKSIRLVDAERGELLRVTTPKASARYSDVNGRPVFWYVEAGQIILVPTPATARTITHYYQATETALSGDTDEPTIPDYAIDLVIVKAALKLAARMNETAIHRLLAQEERDQLDALANDARRSKGSPVLDSRRDWTRRGWSL